MSRLNPDEWQFLDGDLSGDVKGPTSYDNVKLKTNENF